MESSGAFRLVVRRGPQPDKIYILSKDFTSLGREAMNDIAINDPEVSRQHMRLSREGGGYVIEDLGSTNGTFVNGARITGAYALADGDEIGLGETVTLVYQASVGEALETIMSPSAAFDLPPEPAAAAVADAPPPPFDIGPPSEPEPLPPFPSEPVADAPPPPAPFMSDPEPAPPPPPPPPPSKPAPPPPSRPPTTAKPGAPPAYTPAEAEEKPKSRKGLLIGCGCLLLLIICAISAGVAYLLWNAPTEFWNDPINNFDNLFSIIMPLAPLF